MTSDAPFPPVEQPADGDWTSQVPAPGLSGGPRFSASASVPMPPSLPQRDPGRSEAGRDPGGAFSGFSAGAPSFSPPTQHQPGGPQFSGGPQMPGQNPQYGQSPVQSSAPTGQYPQQAPAGNARVAASASVPLPPVPPVVPAVVPAMPAPSGPYAPPAVSTGSTYGAPQSTVYGQAAPPSFGSAPFAGQSHAGQSHAGQPHGGPAQASMGQGQGMGQGPGHGGMGQGPAMGQAPGMSQGPGMGQGPGGMGQGGMAQGGMGQGGMGQVYAPGGYGQDQRGGDPRGGDPRGGDPRGGDPRGRERMAPTGGWPYVEAPPGEARRPRRWLLITVITIGALILVGGAAVIGYTLFSRGSAYQVGACVKQQGDGAVVVECNSAGAFQIVSLVDGEDQCPDPTQPSVELTGGGKGRQIACLKPAAS